MTQPTTLFAGSYSRTLIPGSWSGGRFALLENVAPAGRSTPAHVHAREEETPYVLSGRLRCDLPGGGMTLAAGEHAVLRRGVPHRLATDGADEVRYLLLCTPAGFEDFVAEAGVAAPDFRAPAPEPDAAAIARIVAAAPRHGIILLPDIPAAPGPISSTEPCERIVMGAAGLSIEVIAKPGPSAQDPVLLRTTMPPGAVVPVHAHPESECFYVLAGRLEVYIGSSWTEGCPGALLQIPSGVMHAIRNRGHETVVALTVTDGSLLNFFRAAADPEGTEPGPPSAAQLQRLIEIATAHGCAFGSPEQQAAAGLA